MESTNQSLISDKSAAGFADIAELVNFRRYPLDDLTSPAAQRVVADGQAQLARDGLCLLPDFIAPAALGAMAAEARALYSGAYHAETDMTHSSGFPLPSSRLPRPSRNSASAVAYDRIPPASPLRRLYECDGVVWLVREILGVPQLYRTADPLLSCLLMYYGDGDELGWHFDPNDGVVTLLLEAPQNGGIFEFAPNILGHDPDGTAAVTRVMDGGREGVIAQALRPGTLSIFRGVKSLHRVTKVTGSVPRAILTMSYDPKPGVQFSPENRRRYSGRVA